MATNDPNMSQSNDPTNPYPAQPANPANPPPGSPGLPIPPGLGARPNEPLQTPIGGLTATQLASGTSDPSSPANPATPGSITPSGTTTSTDPGAPPITATQTTQGGGLSDFTAGMTPDQVRALSNQYIGAGGANNIDNGQYWVDKYAQWGASDPGYFETRLKEGIGDQSGYNGAFGNIRTPGNAAATTPGGGGAGYVPGPTTQGPWTGTTPGQGTDLYNMLMKRANQSEIIDPNDPTIRSQVDPAVAQLQRQNTQNLAATAERAGSNANIGAETRAGSEAVGQGAATIEGQVMGQQLAARQQEIQQALSGAQGLLTNEQQMNLQEELAKLQLAQQQSQYEQTLGQNAYQFGTNTQLNAAGL